MNRTIYINGKPADTAALIALSVVSRDEIVADVILEQMDDSWNHPKADPVTRRTGRAGRNDPCDCGSGKKWKKCCGSAAKRGDA